MPHGPQTILGEREGTIQTQAVPPLGCVTHTHTLSFSSLQIQPFRNGVGNLVDLAPSPSLSHTFYLHELDIRKALVTVTHRISIEM